MEIQEMMTAIKSDSLIVEANRKETITFNPFNPMGVAFLSVYSFVSGPNNVEVYAGGQLIIVREVKNKGETLINFNSPIILKKDSKLEIKVGLKSYIHYHIFTPAERELDLYPNY